MLKEKDARYTNLSIANIPRDVLLASPKIHQQWGVFLPDELGNYLQTSSIQPRLPIKEKYKKFFYDIDAVYRFPHTQILNLCKTDENLTKYGCLLPSDYNDEDTISKFRDDMEQGSTTAKKIWRIVQQWKLGVLFQNKKGYYFGWSKNDATTGTFSV